MPIPTLNLIGPGRLGQTLAHLWQGTSLVQVAGILGRNPARTALARGFIGSGAVIDWHDLRPADLTLIATSDDALASIVEQLAASHALRSGDVVFHCSGALSCDSLAPLRAKGVHVASIHPLKSFARPELAVTDFAGTYCGYEGDVSALALLLPLFSAIGGQCFQIVAANKTLYHAGAVLGCNALVALMHAALQSMEAAGVPQNIAWPALRPLIDGTLANIGRLGPAGALTGPVMRGDVQTVARQYAALNALDPELAEVYAALGRVTLKLANLSTAQQESMRSALKT